MPLTNDIRKRIDVNEAKKIGINYATKFHRSLGYEEGKYELPCPNESETEEFLDASDEIKQWDEILTATNGIKSEESSVLNPLMHPSLIGFASDYPITSIVYKWMKEGFEKHDIERGNAPFNPKAVEKSPLWCTAKFFDLNQSLSKHYLMMLGDPSKKTDVNQNADLQTVVGNDQKLKTAMMHMKVLEPIYKDPKAPTNLVNQVEACRNEKVFSNLIQEKFRTLTPVQQRELQIYNGYEAASIFDNYVKNIIKTSRDIAEKYNSDLGKDIDLMMRAKDTLHVDSTRLTSQPYRSASSQPPRNDPDPPSRPSGRKKK